MLRHAAVVLGVVLMPQMANARSYLADLPCFCGTVPRASDELEYFMNSPVEALDFTVPMFELGLMANTTEGLRHWLYNQVLASGCGTPRASETMYYVGTADGRFIGYFDEHTTVYRGPSAGSAADALPGASSTKLIASCGSQAAIARTCPTTGSTECNGCQRVVNMSGVSPAATSCCDSNIRATYSTSRSARGTPQSFTTWKLYDPRVRSWFKAARARWTANHSAPKIGWSPIYQFATSKKLGVTATGTIIQGGALAAVFGIDFSLDHVSSLLIKALTGNNQWAYIIERSGPNEGMLVGSTSVRPKKACSRGCIAEKLFSVDGSRLRANVSGYSAFRDSSDMLKKTGYQSTSVKKMIDKLSGSTFFNECFMKRKYQSCPLDLDKQYNFKGIADLGETRAAGPKYCSPPTSFSCMKNNYDFGGNPKGYVNGTYVKCGYAKIVGIVASSANYSAPGWFKGALSVEPTLDGPAKCQEICQRTQGCDFWSYEFEDFVGFEAESKIFAGPNGEFDWLLVAGQDVKCQPGSIYFEGACVNCGSGQEPDELGQSCLSCKARAATFEYTNSGLNGSATDGVCHMCPYGKLPNDARSVCIPCAAGKFDSIENNRCENCPVGQFSDVGAFSAGKVGDYNPACKCAKRFFTARTASHQVSISCHGSGYREKKAFNEEGECASCDLLDCVSDCNAQNITVKPGWRIEPHELTDDASKVKISLAIFRCTAEEACPGGAIDDIFHAVANACKEGHMGVLCGQCSTGFAMQFDHSCEACEMIWSPWKIAFLVIVIIAVFVILGALPASAYHRILDVVQMFQMMGEIGKEVGFSTLLKIFTVSLQIIGGIANVLDLSMPAFFKDIIGTFANMFSFDFFSLFGGSCFTTGSYVSALIANVCLTTTTLLAIVANYFVQLRRYDWEMGHQGEKEEQHMRKIFKEIAGDDDTIDKAEFRDLVQHVAPGSAGKDADALFDNADVEKNGTIDFDEFHTAALMHSSSSLELDFSLLVKRAHTVSQQQKCITRLFVLAFLLYPGLTNRIFAGLACRDLSRDSAVQIVDYGVSCSSSEYYTTAALCVVLIFLWPIGLPTAVFLSLHKYRKLILEKDPDTLHMFGNLIMDYKPQYYWWEVVEFVRKLILMGVIGLVGRGTVSQAFAACLVAAGFLAVTFREQPYEKAWHNRLKIFTDFQVFVILLICLVLQTQEADLSEEKVGIDAYSYMMTAITISIIPLSLVALWDSASTVAGSLKELKEHKEPSHLLKGAFTNPMVDNGEEFPAGEE